MATAHRWWHRWLEADAAQRASGVWLQDRSSRPRRQPRHLSAEAEARICAVREATGWGPRLVAGATGHPHQTVWKVFSVTGSHAGRGQRAGSPIATSGPAPAICCTWTSAAIRASVGPGIARPAIAPSATGTGCTRDPRRRRLRPRDRRRPLAPGLRRAARRRTRRHRHRLPPARPGVLRRPRHHRAPA